MLAQELFELTLFLQALSALIASGHMLLGGTEFISDKLAVSMSRKELFYVSAAIHPVSSCPHPRKSAPRRAVPRTSGIEFRS